MVTYLSWGEWYLHLESRHYMQYGAVLTPSISHKYSRKTPNSSPVRARYGVSVMNPASDWYSASVYAIIYVISYNIWPRYNGTLLYCSAYEPVSCGATLEMSTPKVPGDFAWTYRSLRMTSSDKELLNAEESWKRTYLVFQSALCFPMAWHCLT